ncbi:hypothetical protein [Bacillus sp. FJAT-27445]|uniref:hypothetical protein n=1 Tax=Bacillus sp. FJAT-27445 TaxID=1679166 RepID=UPI0012E34159|nr:hypothetical protein [Bacillus sp. FJAT-27445]
MPLKKSLEERVKTDALERQLLLFVQKTVNAEMAPIYNTLNQLTWKITKLEGRLSELEKMQRESAANQSRLLDEYLGKCNGNTSDERPVIYQEIKVEKLFIEQYDQVNNLGNVGIKELSGHLNIGTTYEKAGLEETDDETKAEFSKLNEEYKIKMNKLKDKVKNEKDDS